MDAVGGGVIVFVDASHSVEKLSRKRIKKVLGSNLLRRRDFVLNVREL